MSPIVRGGGEGGGGGCILLMCTEHKLCGERPLRSLLGREWAIFVVSICSQVHA